MFINGENKLAQLLQATKVPDSSIGLSKRLFAWPAHTLIKWAMSPWSYYRPILKICSNFVTTNWLMVPYNKWHYLGFLLGYSLQNYIQCFSCGSEYLTIELGQSSCRPEYLCPWLICSKVSNLGQQALISGSPLLIFKTRNDQMTSCHISHCWRHRWKFIFFI